MVPTLMGRIQTRVFLLGVIGALVTAAITPVLPASGPLGERYRTAFVVLATVAILGVAWEIVYHAAMQWRWEKDWPTMFGLMTLIPEGVLVGFLAVLGLIPLVRGSVPAPAFVIQFLVVWFAVWLFANGPMRAPFIRWRFRGGRLV